MEDFCQELKGLKVLLRDDIERLRQYINKKFPHYDKTKKAQILINSIKSILDQHMIGLPPQYKGIIRDKLLKEVLISKSDGLFMYDIFEASVSLEKEDANLSKHICTWVNKHISSPISILPEFESKNLELKSASNIYELKEFKDIKISSSTGLTLKKAIEMKQLRIALFIALITISAGGLYGPLIKYFSPPQIAVEEPIVYLYPHLPSNFYYKEIDTAKLKAYLNTRNSILSQEPYYSAIIETSKEFELNPLILFAIAGHEQGFVPIDHPSALKIANNPFNVFHSWQSYNTNIIDSSRIAARTIINLSKDRPEEMNPFQWINRKYAEDENWWKGINSIYNRLEKEVE